MPTEDSDDGLDLALLRRRRKQKQARRRMLIAASGVGVCLLLVVGVLAVRAVGKQDGGPGGPGLFGPSTGSEGEKWTLAELREYLTGRGVNCRMKQVDGGLHVWFIFSKNDDDYQNAVFIASERVSDPRVVECWKGQSVESERDAAGADPERCFAWGRFMFRGHRGDLTNLDAIHRALTGKPFRR